MLWQLSWEYVDSQPLCSPPMSQMLFIPGEVFGMPELPAPFHRTLEPIVYWEAYQNRSTSGWVGKEIEERDQYRDHHSTWSFCMAAMDKAVARWTAVFTAIAGSWA